MESEWEPNVCCFIISLLTNKKTKQEKKEREFERTDRIRALENDNENPRIKTLTNKKQTIREDKFQCVWSRNAMESNTKIQEKRYERQITNRIEKDPNNLMNLCSLCSNRWEREEVILFFSSKNRWTFLFNARIVCECMLTLSHNTHTHTQECTNQPI